MNDVRRSPMPTQDPSAVPPSERKPLVVLRDVRKSFEHMGRTLEVLRGVDLTLEEGEFVGIVGQSGAGKSTLLHCVGTLDVPTSGTIVLDGEDITRISRSKLADVRNRTVGFVFQFHHLLPEFNALENVMMPGIIQGRPKREMEPRALALLEEMGLGHRATHRPGELSGGEQQRVALARALVLSPKLILADEPTGNLDSATSAHIHELFFAINKKLGTTIVIVTHNTALAGAMPRVVTLRDGRVEKDERVGSGEAAAARGAGAISVASEREARAASSETAGAASG